MKEVLTKSFWRGVTKTFYQALEGPPSKIDAPQKPVSKEEPAPPKAPDKTQESTRDD